LNILRKNREDAGLNFKIPGETREAGNVPLKKGIAL